MQEEQRSFRGDDASDAEENEEGRYGDAEENEEGRCGDAEENEEGSTDHNKTSSIIIGKITSSVISGICSSKINIVLKE